MTRARRSTRGLLIATGLCAVIAAGACTWPAATGETGATSAGAPGTPDPDTDAVIRAAAAGTALAAVGELMVKGRAPRTGYDRDRFGQRWADVDHNGCDTRNDVLARDLTDVVVAAGTGGCTVLSGVLADPYSGTTIAFVRGADTSDDVQIDHVVALSDAWQKGAQGWDAVTRTAFANDPLNLLAVDGATNTAKGDGDAATWLPPDRDHRCAYVGRQVAVKQTYGIWVTAAERTAMVGVLAGCPGLPLPAGTGAASPGTGTPSVPAGGPSSTAAPAEDCVVKGNVSGSGEKIYHLPGQENYEATVITASKGERWFCSAAAAEAAGWRAARR